MKKIICKILTVCLISILLVNVSTYTANAASIAGIISEKQLYGDYGYYGTFSAVVYFDYDNRTVSISGQYPNLVDESPLLCNTEVSVDRGTENRGTTAYVKYTLKLKCMGVTTNVYNYTVKCSQTGTITYY